MADRGRTPRPPAESGQIPDETAILARLDQLNDAIGPARTRLDQAVLSHSQLYITSPNSPAYRASESQLAEATDEVNRLAGEVFQLIGQLPDQSAPESPPLSVPAELAGSAVDFDPAGPGSRRLLAGLHSLMALNHSQGRAGLEAIASEIGYQLPPQAPAELDPDTSFAQLRRESRERLIDFESALIWQKRVEAGSRLPPPGQYSAERVQAAIDLQQASGRLVEFQHRLLGICFIKLVASLDQLAAEPTVETKLAGPGRAAEGPVASRIIDSLAADPEPVTTTGLTERLNAGSGLPVKLKRVRNRLYDLTAAGRIQRVAPGWYAGLDFDASGWQPPDRLPGPETIRSRVLETVVAADQPLKRRQIDDILFGPGGDGRPAGSSRSALNFLVQNGAVTQVARGYYASPDFDASGWQPEPEEPSADSVSGRILTLMEAGGGQLLDAGQTQAELAASGSPVSLDYVRSCLSDLALAGRLDRPRPGSYRWPESTPRPPARTEAGPPALERTRQLGREVCRQLAAETPAAEAAPWPSYRAHAETVIAIIRTAGRPLAAQEIMSAAAGRISIKPTSLRSLLPDLARGGLIKRVGWGVYTVPDDNLAEFKPPVDYQPREESLLAEVLDVIRAAGRPLVPMEIRSIMAANDGSSPGGNSISSSLSYLLGRGCLKRLDSGGYIARDHNRPDASPDPAGPAGGDPAPRPPEPDAIADVVAGVVRAAGRPLTGSQIIDLSAEAGRAVQRDELDSLAAEGKIKQFGSRTYAPVDFWGTVPLDPDTIAGGIVGLVEAAGRPMTLQAIMSGLNQHRDRRHNYGSIRTIIGQLADQGLVRRLEPGIYAAAGYDDGNYQPVRPDVGSIVEIIEAAGRPLTEAEIIELTGEPAPRTLGELARQGRIRRFGRRAYAPAGFHGPPPPTESEAARIRIVQLLEAAGRPLQIAELRQQLSEEPDAAGEIRKIQTDLSALVRWGWIQRPGRGIYAAADSAVEPDDSQLPFNQRVVDLLDRLQRPLTTDKIFDALVSAGGRPPTLASLQTQLSKFRQEDRIRQLESGDWVSRRYRLRPGQRARLRLDRPSPGSQAERVVSVLEAAGRPLKLGEIFNRLQAIEPIPNERYQQITNQLPYYARAGWVRRLGNGVYAAV